MAMTTEEVIGIRTPQGVGQPSGPPIRYGATPAGVVPLQGDGDANVYQSWEQMAAEVWETLSRLYPHLPELDRVIYRNAAGVWVRVVYEHSGESHQIEREGQLLTIAARFPQERRVALTLKEAASHGWDWFQPGRGWIRRGVKRERDLPENLGHASSRPVSWEEVINRSPSPTWVPQATDTLGAQPVGLPSAPPKGKRVVERPAQEDSDAV